MTAVRTKAPTINLRELVDKEENPSATDADGSGLDEENTEAAETASTQSAKGPAETLAARK